MSGPEGHSNLPVDFDWVPERGPSVSKWHIPRALKRLLPSFVINTLQDFKRRALARDFPRNEEFEQSPDEAHASASMSIVVPIHDAPIFTRRCLSSLEKYASEAEIILLDDASKLNETLDVIRHFSSRNGWKVIRNEKSAGHSAACGAGAKLATRPYLCLLNSDSVATPWCWKLLKEVFERDQEIGVTAPSTSHGGTPQTLSLACEIRFHLNDNQICAFAHRLLTETQEPVVVDMPWVSGFAFFIRRELWQDLGGFDPNLPDYGNEVELCKRIKDKGQRIVWVRNSYIHHFGQQSYQSRVGLEGIHARIRAAVAYIESKASSKSTVA
jgi:GT2 family glycosyltransferase